jgi:hypothetical protein
MELKKIDIKTISDDWNNCIASNSTLNVTNCSIAYNPCFAEIFEDVFGYTSEYYYLIENEKIIGLLPGFRINNKYTSIPMFPSAGIFAFNEINKLDIYKNISNHLGKYEIRDTIKFSHYTYDKKVLCYIPLEKTSDLQFDKLTSDKRNHIRKGYKNGLSIKYGGSEFLDDFYNIYSYNMRHLGSPVIEKNFFLTLIKRYKYGIAKIFICYYGNIPVGGSFILSYSNLLEVSWASTLIDYNKLKPNMVLYWEMIKYSIDNGIHFFSFGRSTKGSGAHEFKLRWGALEQPLFFNYSNYTFDIRRLKLLSTIWRKLPLKAVNKIGPLLRRFTKI